MKMAALTALITLLSLISPAVSIEMSATCYVRPNSASIGLTERVNGTVAFHQVDANSDVHITIMLEGFNTSDMHPQHGFHIHTKAVAEEANDCATAGGHYNPDMNMHGGPDDNSTSRHAGDLGNIEEMSNGTIDLMFSDNYISLQGSYNIIGLAVVIHQSEDTLDESVDASGGAGARIACCTVVESQPGSAVGTSVSVQLLAMALLLKMLL